MGVIGPCLSGEAELRCARGGRRDFDDAHGLPDMDGELAHVGAGSPSGSAEIGRGAGAGAGINVSDNVPDHLSVRTGTEGGKAAGADVSGSRATTSNRRATRSRASDDPIAATPQNQSAGRLHLLRNREMRLAVVSATGASLALRPTIWMAPSDGAVQGSSFALEMCSEHGSVLGTASISSTPIAAPSASLSSPAL